MPKTTPKEDAALAKMQRDSNQPRYVNCDLTTAQKQELDVFIEETNKEDLLQWFVSMVAKDHTISSKQLDVGYQASATGGKNHGNHANICLISRSSSPERALYSLMFKDTMILKGIWPVSNRLEDLD